ncbi:hypothetical protein SSX86_017965 [Deinandra increscens subsp. villosa]|uniref:RRP12 HEAT domain-containing protein n=1 Tax=Deinandra increscens subsp. villosa TaxID=3103831 RepID=A0AAP0GUR3_9ASTR
MHVKFSTKILNHFKSLLALHHSAATRRITDALYQLCLQPTVHVSPEALVDLLCLLATSVSSNEMSGDNLTFTARLLNVGMKKVYSFDRQACVVKLPVVFTALTVILASEHEEPLAVAMEALKSLIHACIDETLIKQGVDQIRASGMVRKSAPAIIERLCAIVESLLDYRFAAVWDMSFQVMAAMFDKLGEFSSCFLKGALKSLEDIQKLPDEDFPYRKHLHDCIGVAVVALGPETFLKFLPLNIEAQDPSDVNVWLFPILKQNIVGARLSFFNESLLDSIGLLKLKSAKHKQEGRIHSARSVDSLVHLLWSLLPSFCNYPVDTAESFKDLETELLNSLRVEFDFRGVICSSLQKLIQQNKIIKQGENEASGKVGISQQHAVSLYTSEVAASNLDVLRSSASEILFTLSQIFVNSSKDDGGSLQRTIGEFVSIAYKSVVSRLFKSILNKLVKVKKEIANSSNGTSSLTLAKLYDLAVTVLPGLGTTEVDLLFGEVKSELKNQEKAYKLLSAILKHDDGFIARRFEELLKLMIEVMDSCPFSAKQHRLDCLYFLIEHVFKEKPEQMKREIVDSFLTQILLGLKESNKKTRNRAKEIIRQIGHACMDENKGGNKENLYNFFNMVAIRLADETPHIISAAMQGVSHLTYEFNDLLSLAFNVLPSTFLLLQRSSREINKATLGFLKVLVSKSQAEVLQTHMRGMVEALMSPQSSSKIRFSAKVKQLLEMLVKKCGLDAVREVMPEEHVKLLTNIRKTIERKKRKHSANTEETKSRLSKATTSRFKGASKRLAEDSYEQLNDEPLDLLDREKTRSSLRSSDSLKRKLRPDDEPEIDADGRLIITENNRSFKRDVTAIGSNSDVRSVASRKTGKRRKTSQSGWAYTGSEYSCKKGGGDLKRKGKLEPYAYWPLDRKMVSRRPEHRAAARKGMCSVVKRLEGQTVLNALAIKGLQMKRKKKSSHKKHG